MSNVLDPAATFDYVAVQHKHKDEPPTLVFRYVTSREYVQMSRLLQEADRVVTNEADHLGLCYKALTIPLVGWRNIDLPFAAGDLDAVTSPADVVELRQRLLLEMTNSEIDLKNSARQSHTTTAKSVAVAETGSTSAKGRKKSNSPA